MTVAWVGCYLAALAIDRWTLAVDASNSTYALVGIVSSVLSFLGVVLAGRRSRNSTQPAPAPALLAALADLQERLEETEHERDRYKGERDEERAARLSDLRALAEAKGLTKPRPPGGSRRPRE